MGEIMTYQEAKQFETRLGDNAIVEIVRILPESIDPIKPNDNGWDCKVTYCYNDTVYED